MSNATRPTPAQVTECAERIANIPQGGRITVNGSPCIRTTVNGANYFIRLTDGYAIRLATIVDLYRNGTPIGIV